MKRISRSLLVLAVLAVMLTSSVGCSRGAVETEKTRSLDEALGDAATTASVKLDLAFERGVRATDINVDTDRGIVTLNGEVASEAERQLAVKVAEDVSGVKEVVNHIHVRS